MRRARKSLLFTWACALARCLRNLFARSRAVRFVSVCYERADADFQNGWFHALSDRERNRSCLRYRFRRLWMYGIENSRLLGLGRRLLHAVWVAEVGSFGTFGMLYGAFSACIVFVRGTEETERFTLLFSLILIVVSVPLLQMKRPLGSVIRQSVIVGWFLFSFCGFSEPSVCEEEKESAHHWQALFWAIVCGCLCLVVPPLFLILAAVGLLSLWLLFAIPEVGALLILFTFPLLHTLDHPTAILCVLVLLTELAWLAKALCGRRSFRFGITDFAVALLILLYLLGGAVGVGNGLRAALIQALFLSFWFPAVNLLSRPLWRKRALGAICGGGLIASVVGITQYVLGKAPLLWVDLNRFSDIGGRVCGCFLNPNIFAVFLLLTAPVQLCAAVDSTQRRMRRTVSWIGFLLSICALVLTWTRGAWLGILAALLFIAIAYSCSSFGGLLLASVPVFSLLPFLPNNVINRFTSIGSFTDSSTRYRLYTWRGIVRLVREWKWGIGTGQEAFATLYPRFAVSGTETVAHAHQIFLQVLTELGVAGLAVFLLFLLLLFLETVCGLRDLHGRSRAELLGCAAAILGCLIMGLFDHIWYQQGMLCLLTVLCAILSGTVWEGKERNVY